MKRSAVKIKAFIEPLSTTNGTVVKRRYLDVANCAICDGCLTPTPQNSGTVYWTEDIQKLIANGLKHIQLHYTGLGCRDPSDQR